MRLRPPRPGLLARAGQPAAREAVGPSRTVISRSGGGFPTAVPISGNRTRLDPLDYSGLRGEGSTPVPLPPPACPRPFFLRRTSWQLSPVAAAIFHMRSGLKNSTKRGFCGFSRTAESVRFPIRHIEVRILPSQPSSPVSGDSFQPAPHSPEISAFRAFDFVSRLPIPQSRARSSRKSPALTAEIPVLKRLSAETGWITTAARPHGTLFRATQRHRAVGPSKKHMFTHDLGLHLLTRVAKLFNVRKPKSSVQLQ
jgi:hypothetical protein